MDTDKLKYKERTHLIIKSFYEVYNDLGDGFLKSVYENAMTLALQQQDEPTFKRLVFNKQQQQSA